MKTIVFLFTLTLFTAGCGGEQQSTTAAAAADSSKADSALVLPQEPEIPQVNEKDADGIDPVEGTYPMRSKAEIAALEKMRKEAATAERNYLVSARLNAWMKDKKQSIDIDGIPVNPKLEDSEFAQLESREKWGYALFYPEDWNQICAEATVDFSMVNAIGSVFPETWEFDSPSERQVQALEGQEAELVSYLAQAQSVSSGMLYFVGERNLKQAAPHLVRIYEQSETKDYLILTALVHLMHNAKYEPFLKTKMNKVLFDGWLETIPCSEDNVKFILALSKKFAQ